MSHETSKNNRPPHVEMYHDGDGVRVRRRSSDGCWPLRRADGRSWAEAKAEAERRTPQDCEYECEVGHCVCPS